MSSCADKTKPDQLSQRKHKKVPLRIAIGKLTQAHTDWQNLTRQQRRLSFSFSPLFLVDNNRKEEILTARPWIVHTRPYPTRSGGMRPSAPAHTRLRRASQINRSAFVTDPTVAAIPHGSSSLLTATGALFRQVGATTTWRTWHLFALVSRIGPTITVGVPCPFALKLDELSTASTTEKETAIPHSTGLNSTSKLSTTSTLCR